MLLNYGPMLHTFFIAFLEAKKVLLIGDISYLLHFDDNIMYKMPLHLTGVTETGVMLIALWQPYIYFINCKKLVGEQPQTFFSYQIPCQANIIMYLHKIKTVHILNIYGYLLLNMLHYLNLNGNKAKGQHRIE